MIFLLVLVPPLLAAALALAVRPYRTAVGRANVGLALVPLGAAGLLWADTLAGRPAATWGPGGLLRADALSVLLVFCISLVALLAVALGPGLGPAGPGAPGCRRFRIFVNLFTFTMLLAVTTDNVGLMWVAVEATTITSAVLVPLSPSRASVEASWKYLLIGSVGIALALAGTVLAHVDFVHTAGRSETALAWTGLLEVAPRLHPEVLRLAFVFLLVGYGTKAGLAPMHTWLPDAHAEAPAPLSALMSGVLLAVALYALLRWKAVTDAALGPGFTDELLAGLGLLSLAIAALSLVVQRNYKRMLAYSSVEHTGLACLGLALGPPGVFAAMLHVLNHAVAKSALFLLAGRVLARYGTAELDGVSGLLRVMPWTGGLLAAGVLALAGLPPFGLFISEFALVRAGFAAGRPWLMGVVLALLAVAFVALIGHLTRLLYGPAPPGLPAGEGPRLPLVLLSLGLLLLVVLGLALPAPVTGLLDRIVEVVGR